MSLLVGRDLYNQVAAGANQSMSGLPNWSFDIGGFALEDRYLEPNPQDLAEWRELNLRWFQFGRVRAAVSFSR